MNSKSPGHGIHLPSPVQEISPDELRDSGVRLFLKRDDLISKDFPGNKWRKLRLNLRAARDIEHSRLLTFGGAYSNHLRAVAAAGREFGFDTIGVVRGEEHLPLNEVLTYARSCGMHLTYMDRSSYRHKHEPAVVETFRERFGDFYLVPEGGSNVLGVRGCLDLAAEIPRYVDHVVCPVGTGGTLAGLAYGLRNTHRVVGTAALRGGAFLIDDVRRLQFEAFGESSDNWRIELDHHFGGFAKMPPELRDFRTRFAGAHGIVLEPVYVVKMMYGLWEMVTRGRFEPGASIMAVVTG